MLPVYPSLERQLDQVVHAAAAVGLEEMAARTAQRVAGLDQPFMIFVMGEADSGKSTVINHLAGGAIAAPQSSGGRWINVYRRRRGRTEFAHIHRANDPEHGEVVSIDQARALVRSWEESEEGLDVEQVVWHLNARGLHRHLALVEIPAGHPICGEALWDADAVLWVVSANRTIARPPSEPLRILQRERSPFIPATCVVTRMDQLDPAAWLSCLRAARNEVGPSFEHVVPFALENGAVDATTPAVSPLRRSIVTWLSDEAKQTRQKKFRQYAALTRRAVARNLEGEIEQLLDASARFEVFQNTLPTRVDEELEAMSQHIEGFLSLLSDSYTAHGERLEHAVHPFAVGPFVPPVSATVLFARLSHHLNELAAELGASVSWALDGNRLGNAGRVTAFTDFVRSALPEPPVRLLDQLMRLPAGSKPAEAEIFRGEGDHGPRIPTDAVVLFPSRMAAERLIRTTRTAINQWLSAAKVVVADAATRIASEGFFHQFGHEPTQVSERLAILEDHYARLMCEEPRALILQHPATAPRAYAPGLPLSAA